ncbi:uncharacterized protein LOC115540494 isoform X2 [Gadus morhua]|uniref:uncharacterized protein LOC115540494 isoform X2 n=1 Tax=Gadus morhua TaxID=8049 RepID=UPI0011B3EC87|nr:uncharacterized protein LOC115540494 isoform X2 [Gadus morhua]
MSVGVTNAGSNMPPCVSYRTRASRGFSIGSLTLGPRRTMAGRLAFQTQLASIMEVLANTAVAEICKLVDDDYAVVSLQMSQCQRENKALKRKLNLMELKMARGFAERRLRDSAASIGRTRVHVGSNDRFRASPAASGVVFEGQMDMVPWPGGVVRETTTCDLQQDTSADVELLETELVKQEKMEETEEEVQLIRADGQMERGPGGGRVQRSSRPQQEVQAAYHHNECPDPAPSASTRGVEKEEEPDVTLVKQEAGLESPDHSHPTIIIQDVSVGLPLDNTNKATSQPVQELQECWQGFSQTPADPQAKPSEEPCTTIPVHAGATDTNTQSKDSTSQQPRRPGSEAAASEVSVLDLEAFFTRWTPDSGAPPTAPPSFSTEELLEEEEEEEEEVVLVGEDHHPPRRRRGFSQRSSRIHTNHSPSPGNSLSGSPRLQAPPQQPTWSRAAAMMRTTQPQSLQHRRHGYRAAHRGLHAPQNPLATTVNANAGLSGVGHRAGTLIRRLQSFPSYPPAGHPAGGSERKALTSDGSGLGGVSIGLDGVGRGLDSVSMGLGGVSLGLGGIGMGLGGVRVGQDSISMGSGSVGSRLGSVNAGLADVRGGLGSVSGGLGGVSAGLGGVNMGLCGDGTGIGDVSGGLDGISSRLGGGSRRRNYVCRACGKAFSGLSNLEAHQRVHTGEKPFSCSTCGKRFSEAGNLKKHQRVHTGDKPYSCPRCGKRFAWVCSLRTHQQTGAGCGLQGGGPGGPDQ